MADIIATGTSGYATGEIDTATVLVNDVSPRDARHPNGIAAAVVQVEGVLGSGVALKGAKADLVARLAVNMDADGKINLGTDANLNNDLNVPKGGTGRTTLAATKVLLGDGTNDVAFGSGLMYQGPTSIGAGSTRTHEGSTTILGTQALSGVRFYTDFTLSVGQTLTIADGAGRLCIMATGTITINGTIDGIGAGGQGGPASAAGFAGYHGGPGTSQPGGGGGGGGGTTPALGIAAGDGGSAGPAVGGRGGRNSGVAGAQGQDNTGALIGIADPLSIYGGGGGGSGGSGSTGAGGAGGNGGASIILCAPTIILASTAVFNTSGENGSAGAGAAGGGGTAGGGGGGGGGAGNVYIFCRSFADNGATYTQTAGVGGGSVSAASGAAGRAGVKQILIYA